MEPGLSSRDGWHVAILLIGLWIGWIAAVHFIHWPLFLYPGPPHARTDSAIYTYAGELLRSGGTPYLSYWDHKPPVIHWLNAGALMISGGRIWGIWWLSFLTLASTIVLGYLALRQAFGWLPALVGMTYYALSVDSVLAANFPELYALPFQWLTILILLRIIAETRHDAWWGASLGALGALEFFLRQNLIGSACTVGLALGVMLICSGLPRRAVTLLSGALIGFIVVGGAILASLAMQHALAAFWDQAFHYNLLYSSSSWNARFRVAYSGLKQVSPVAGMVLPLGGWLVALWECWQGCRAMHPALLWVVGLWLPIELSLAVMSGRDYWSYFMMLLAPLSFLVALLMSRVLCPSVVEHRGGPMVSSIVALCVAMVVMPLGDLAFEVHDRGVGSVRMRQVAETVGYLEQQGNRYTTLFVWGGAPDLYHLAGKRPISRYLYVLPLLTPGYATNEVVEQFMQEIRADPPAMIIDASGGKEVTPSLSHWNPAWRSPDPANPMTSWLGRSYWHMTPELQNFYVYVHTEYSLSTRIGPLQWSVYVRNR